MASVSTYLNFNGTTEEAFTFYKSVFGTEFDGPLMRMGDVPREDGQPEMSEREKNYVMHVSLPILAGHRIMGTDATETSGFVLKPGNSIYINLEPDTRAEIDQLFAKLSEGGSVEVAPQVMFWGDYYASCTDRFGIGWMFNTAAKA